MGGIIKLCAFLFLIFSQVGFSQSISLQDGFITPAPLGTVENLGQGVASFRIQEMSGTDIEPSVFGGQSNVKVVLDLGDYITLNGVIGDITGTSNGVNVVSLFDIEFNTTNNIITFRQKEVIPADFLGEISFPVKVTQNSSEAESLNGFNANISAIGKDTDADGNTSFFTYTSESSLEVIKSVVNVPSEFSVGTVINYEIEVTNSGDEIISNIEITDPGATITSGNPIASLFPGKSSVVSASYTLTQADIDKGSYRNTARAVGDRLGGEDNVMAISDAGTDVNGNEIVDPLNEDGPDADNDPTNDATIINITNESVSSESVSSMTLIKSISSSGPYVSGSTITYDLVVTNTGRVTLSNIEVEDPGATIISGNPIAILAPGDSVVVTAVYTITQADLDSGKYSNSATATGDSPEGIDDITVVSDAGTDEFGELIEDPLTEESDINPDGDPTNDVTHLILDSCIKIYNEFSPNGDGVNEYFKIKCIRDYPENTVEIFNRWGNLVFSDEGYNNSTILFAGKSKGRVNVRVDEEELPTGTYFYMIDLGNGSDVLKGWLYLNR